ncbi:MAG: hypothetical protein ABEK50_06210 [bacterium]
MFSMIGVTVLFGRILRNSSWFTLSLVALLICLLGVGLSTQPLFSTDGNKPDGLQKMSNEELRDVSGKAILDFIVEQGTSTYNDQLTFTRLEMEGELQLDVGIDNAVIGDYYRGCNDGCYDGGNGSDLAANSLYITGDPYASLQNPYLELAYDNYGSDSSRELEGIRVGTESITGKMYFDLHIASGGIVIDTCCAEGTINDDRTGCMNTWLGCQDLGWGASVEYSNSEDFWLSLNSDHNLGGKSTDNGDGYEEESILWEHQNPYLGNADGKKTGNRGLHTDGQGFWLHSTDDGYANIF